MVERYKSKKLLKRNCQVHTNVPNCSAPPNLLSWHPYQSLKTAMLCNIVLDVLDSPIWLASLLSFQFDVTSFLRARKAGIKL